MVERRNEFGPQVALHTQNPARLFCVQALERVQIVSRPQRQKAAESQRLGLATALIVIEIAIQIGRHNHVVAVFERRAKPLLALARQHDGRLRQSALTNLVPADHPPIPRG